MIREIFLPAWELEPLEAPGPTDTEKRAVWDAYNARRPHRPPVILAVNNRVCLLSRELNAPGLRYREVFTDPEAMLTAQLWHEYVVRMRHHHFCDYETAIPEVWTVGAHFQNVYEAAFFGATVAFREHEVPDTTPPYAGAAKDRVFDVDIRRPAEGGFFRQGIDMTEAMRVLARERTFLGRPIRVQPYLPVGTDGPLTVAMNIRGPEILTDMMEDPAYAHRLFAHIVEAAIIREREMRRYWGIPRDQSEGVGLADDSIALIGSSQYREMVLPHHRRYYEVLDPEGRRRRSMHLCGDAQRHFRVIRDELGVSSFDTGFPLDFRRARAELGPEVEILGGVEVGMLLGGRPQQVHRRAREILDSGILEGGAFILREANNLPPSVPWENLAAMYRAAREPPVPVV